MSTRGVSRPVIVVEAPASASASRPGSPVAAGVADARLAGGSPARIAVCDAWDDADTRPDGLPRLFDTSDTDEVPTLTMRRPRPWTEIGPVETDLEPGEVGLVIYEHVEHGDGRVLPSARRIRKLS